MPSNLLYLGSSIQCTHGAPVTRTAGSQRVKTGGQAIFLLSDTFTVAGCAFTVPGPKPQPCTTVQWMSGARRVTSGGQAVLTESSLAICKSADQIPAGPPTVVNTQTRVSAT
jgi:hypothetical protein